MKDEKKMALLINNVTLEDIKVITEALREHREKKKRS